MSDKATSTEIISVPKGGGAVSGIGETFSPDLHTGTANFSVPIAVPPGRNGFQPDLSLVYSSGNGNGPFGQGWGLGVPGITRKTSKGVPKFDDAHDPFLMSSTEELVLVKKTETEFYYRPRTEGFFGQIIHIVGGNNNYWRVHNKEGLVSTFGSKNSVGNDPAVVANPATPRKVFSWKQTSIEDPFGNRIEYEYERDRGHDLPHHWDQVYLRQIRYADFDGPLGHQFLLTVEFVYEDRPDPYSEYRSGFEIRTRKRCAQIVVRSHAETEQVIRTYDLIYLDQRSDLNSNLPLNGTSLLSQIKVTGHDGPKTESLPSLEFQFTNFAPQKRRLVPLEGPDLPPESLSNSNFELVDLFGNGIPAFVELNGTARYWQNLGNGVIASPRFMKDAPAGVSLSDVGVQFIDANGNGRTDLLVTTNSTAGYFPLGVDGGWDQRSFRRFRQAPSFDLEDPEVKLVDLDGDGVTDALRFGERLHCFFNDPILGWNETRSVERKALDQFPNVSLNDPRVKWGDFSGDGLQDIALVYDGNVEYWPNLGYCNWGPRIHMENSPRFSWGYDAKRILIGDIDGDGRSDIIYVGDTEVTLWINQSGNRWSDPIVIKGTPPASNLDVLRLVDLFGNGIAGVLWSRDLSGLNRHPLYFLDLTGGVKPYLLSQVDNHMGAVTIVSYATSTHHYLEDQKHHETRWVTTLPFPVHVISKMEVSDHFSGGKLTSEYRYHNGYWDGAEREFQGFAMVEQFDTESFENYHQVGTNSDRIIAKVDPIHFSPPKLTKTWFHLGAVGDEFGEWKEMDWSSQYWDGDPQLLNHTERANQFLRSLPITSDRRRVKRDAIRALRGSMLRSELYSLDGTKYESRPWTVSESSYGLAEINPPVDDVARRHIFFPYQLSLRTTQWDRGDDPLTQFSLTEFTDDDGNFDPFGRALLQTQVACPRGWRKLSDKPVEPYLASRSRVLYAEPIGPTYIHNRVAKSTGFEISNTSGKSVMELLTAKDADLNLKILGQTLNFYDGDAFTGLPLGKLGKFGAVTRIEDLLLTDQILSHAYGLNIPPYLKASGIAAWTAEYPVEFRTLLPHRAGYTFHTGSADPSDPKGYFVNSVRRRFDFQAGVGRGLVLENVDPLYDPVSDPSRHRLLISHDKYLLMPEEVTDAAGLVVKAKYDYRVFQPREIIEPNGNKSSFTFSPMGLLEGSLVSGKLPAEGDQLHPSLRMEYGFRSFEDSPPAKRKPVFVRTIRRVHHESELDVLLPERNDTITTVEYSDGFGRLLQTRTEGEEVRFGDAKFGGGDTILAPKQSAPSGADVVGKKQLDVAKPNVIVSGWQIYDNKGRVVQKYEPFFSEGWEYDRPDEAKSGQRVTMFYDPLGHEVRTVSPDGSEQRIIYGVPGRISKPDILNPDIFEPTPWETYTYDANDNAGRTHPATATSYLHHWNTPTSTRSDALGRVVETVERNRVAPANPGDPLPPIKELRTRTTYDIHGNILKIVDALGRSAFDSYVYDYANNKLRWNSIDAGSGLSILDAVGNVIEQRDDKGALILHSFDGLNRQIRQWTRDSLGQKLGLRQRIVYGDSGSAAQSASDRATNRAANRLGKLFQQFDEAGVLSFDKYDFKGNVVSKTRRVIGDAALLAPFAAAPPGWVVEPFRVDWANPASITFESRTYASDYEFDALNRAKKVVSPEDVENRRRILKPQYNRAGALERVMLEHTGPAGTISEVFVEHIAYNAKGQRIMISYGNGVMTRYAYDPQSLHHLRCRSERYTKPSDLTYHPTGAPLQDLAYEHDFVGNLLQLSDRTPDSGVVNSVLGLNALDRTFTYDASYQLTSATGRECDSPPNLPWENLFRSTDLTRTRSYSETYLYDQVGNIEQMKHVSTGGGFTREFIPFSGANRLKTLKVGSTSLGYQYDPKGNLKSETTSRHFEWDHADRMKVFRTQTAGSEPSLYAQYLYDPSGQRTKKLVHKQGGSIEVTTYIDGIFEYQRTVSNGVTRENNSLHLMDNQSRVAIVRIGNPFPDDATPAVKYHLGDHLGSSNLVVDQAANIINREEYTPYGETSFGSFARKRYRFTGKERDSESGLSYHGARYYVSWLGRWASCDPLGVLAGPNVYRYVKNNPVVFHDSTGLDPDQAEPTSAEKQDQASSVEKHFAGPPVAPAAIRTSVVGRSYTPDPRLAPDPAMTRANIVTRRIDPKNPQMASPDVYGMKPTNPESSISPGEHSLAQHIIKGEGSKYISASQLPNGADTVDGRVYWIDMDKLPPGTKVVSNEEIAKDLDRLVSEGKITRERADMWLKDQRIKEAEILIEGEVPRGAVSKYPPQAPKASMLPGGISMGTGTLQIYAASQEENPFLKGAGYAAGGTEVGGSLLFMGGTQLGSRALAGFGARAMMAGGLAGSGLGVIVAARDSLECEKEVSKVLNRETAKGTYPSWFRELYNGFRIGFAFSGM